ncbi:MAG TPA: 23S rRNA (adenine(2503)-C(2))-methyltransferase RlmN [Candidatus Deferrimicrobium sp.]|nr:23S rRNA (adenine(2503)-C(2))-methyltransferase RlmN [Candidatus Deferrimicrobium sp.]
MSKENLLGYSLNQMENLMILLGEKPYKGRQVFKWLYRVRQYDFALMTDLTKDLRSRLDENYTFEGLTPQHVLESRDGTVKILFRLPDGHPIETVLIPDEDKRKTVCLSVQAGCTLACRFCATGTMGLLRDLTVGEIIGQLVYLRERFGENAFTNVVMMGMGEPLLNFDNVIEAIGIMTSEIGLGLSAKKVTISTSGVSPKIKKLADLGFKTRLAVSLHAATQEKRLKIMPVAETFHLDKLMDAVRYYVQKTEARVTFEYILFKDFNDTMDDVMALTRLIQGIPCKINLLGYNPVAGLPFERPTDEHIDWFARQLYPRVPAVTVRKSRGLDIQAACGQLAGQYTERSRISASH